MRFFILFLAFLQVVLTGCSAILEGEAPGTREAAVQMYRYQGLREELIVEPPNLSSSVVHPGDMMGVELKVTVLSPQQGKRFRVLEVMTLSAADVRIELVRQESERPQGLHASTLQVLIPKDLPPGDYTLVATVAAEDQQVRKRTGFLVKK